jgi:hypothetical protein
MQGHSRPEQFKNRSHRVSPFSQETHNAGLHLPPTRNVESTSKG